jgi:serine/threonine protein kinase
MSPEQAEGKPIDGRSDIFAFGAVLYEMITGHRAFPGETKMSTLAAILNREPTPPSEYVEGLPRAVESMIGRRLRKEAARRLQHMDDLKIAIEELRDDSRSGRLTSERPARIPGPRRKKWKVVTAAVAVVLAFGAEVLFWKRLACGSAGQPAAGGRSSLIVSVPGWIGEPTLSPDSPNNSHRAA